MDAAVVVFEALATNTLVRFWPMESVPFPLLFITVSEYAPLRLVCCTMSTVPSLFRSTPEISRPESNWP